MNDTPTNQTKTFLLTIATVSDVYFDDEVRSVTCPGSEGEMTILPKHEPLVSVLQNGTIMVRTRGEEKEFKINHGILEIHRGGVIVLL